MMLEEMWKCAFVLVARTVEGQVTGIGMDLVGFDIHTNAVHVKDPEKKLNLFN